MDRPKGRPRGRPKSGRKNGMKIIENPDEITIIVQDKQGNQLQADIQKQDVYDAMKSLISEISGKSDNWYHCYYVLNDKDNKRYGVKNVINEVLILKTGSSSRLFYPDEATYVLEYLGFKCGFDQEASNHRYRRHHNSITNTKTTSTTQ